MGGGLLIFYVTNVTNETNEKSPFSGPPKISDFGVSFGRFRGSFILPLNGGRQRWSRRQRGLTIWLAWEKARSKENMSGLHMRDGFNIKDRVPMGYSVFAICNEVY